VRLEITLRPVLLQDNFGTGLRYYFVAGAEIVPQKGVSNRNKTSLLELLFFVSSSHGVVTCDHICAHG
jgi:hypothetical protein